MIQTWTTDTGTPCQPEEPGYKVVKAWFQKCRDDAAAVEAQKQKIQRLRDIASKTTPSMTGMPGGGGAGDKIGTGAGDIVDEERHLQQMEVDLTELRKEAVRRAYALNTDTPRELKQIACICEYFVNLKKHHEIAEIVGLKNTTAVSVYIRDGMEALSEIWESVCIGQENP